MKEFFPFSGCKSIECVASGVRKGATESQDLLEFCASVEVDLIGRRLLRRRTPRHLRSGGETLVASCFPYGNLRIIRRFVRRGVCHCSGSYRRGVCWLHCVRN